MGKVVLTLILASPIAGVLAGCAETTAAVAPAPEVEHRFVYRSDANLNAVGLAVASLTGAPETVEARFRSAFDAEALQRDINFTDDKATYLLRGYVTAYPTDAGTTAVALVWDIFDAHNKKRAQRLEDRGIVKLSASDPWTTLTDDDIKKIAALSAENLAAFLSNTPEAENGQKTGPASERPNEADKPKLANTRPENSPKMRDGQTAYVQN
jgi:hypothetical protein